MIPFIICLIGSIYTVSFAADHRFDHMFLIIVCTLICWPLTLLILVILNDQRDKNNEL